MQQCAGTSRPHCTRFAGSIRRCGAASSAVFEACVSAAYSKTVHCFAARSGIAWACVPLWLFVCPCVPGVLQLLCPVNFSHLCLFLLRLVRLSDCCPMLSAGWLCQSNTMSLRNCQPQVLYLGTYHSQCIGSHFYSSSLKKAVLLSSATPDLGGRCPQHSAGRPVAVQYCAIALPVSCVPTLLLCRGTGLFGVCGWLAAGYHAGICSYNCLVFCC